LHIIDSRSAIVHRRSQLYAIETTKVTKMPVFVIFVFLIGSGRWPPDRNHEGHKDKSQTRSQRKEPNTFFFVILGGAYLRDLRVPDRNGIREFPFKEKKFSVSLW